MIVLSLGTNLGDRSVNLAQARALLETKLKVTLKCSKELETKAIGFEGEDFLNQVVAFKKPCRLSPRKLLEVCKSIEIEMGRPAHDAEYDESGNRIYHNRIIDIDILFFDDKKISDTDLTIPHPQVLTRGFIKELLEDLDINDNTGDRRSDC